MGKLTTMFSAIANHGKTLAKTAVTVAKGHSPAIFAGTAIVGAFAIGYTAYKCTPKYKQAVEDAETTVTEKEDGTQEIKKEPVAKKKKAKIFFKTMWPMAVAIIVTCSSIVMSHKMSAKKIALLSAAYTTATQKASEAAEKKAEEFIKEKMGDDAAAEYKDKAEKDREITNKIAASSGKDYVIETDGGDDLITDYCTGHSFRASKGYIQARLDAYNQMLKEDKDDCVTYADVMSELVPGFPETGFSLRYGFYTTGGQNDWPLSVTFSVGTTASGEPCYIMSFDQEPAMIYEY